MNKLNSTTFIDNFPNESIFPDKRLLKGDGRSNIFKFLIDVFNELLEKSDENTKELSGEKLYIKHILFQFLVSEYLFEQDLETFLKENGFELNNVFYNFTELKNYISKEKLLLDIKSGKLKISLLFNGLTPIGVVLAKQLENDIEIKKYLDKLRDEFMKKISNIRELEGFSI